MVLQSALLGLGAYLTIKGELSAGAIIAVSVASARALAPVDLAIGNWKAFVAARMAYQRLRETVIALASADEPMRLPAPTARLSVEKITVAVPGTGQVVLSEVAFELEAGQALGIIGPSAGGKTTLVRALTGIWPALRGSVRLDGADLTQWREDDLGRHIGYLPQEVALMDATMEENICRLEPRARLPQGDRGRQGGRRPRDDRQAAGGLSHAGSGRRAARFPPVNASASRWRARFTAIPSWW